MGLQTPDQNVLSQSGTLDDRKDAVGSDLRDVLNRNASRLEGNAETHHCGSLAEQGAEDGLDKRLRATRCVLSTTEVYLAVEFQSRILTFDRFMRKYGSIEGRNLKGAGSRSIRSPGLPVLGCWLA